MKFQEQYSNYIEHYGTRGMRWGVRKEQYKSLNRQQKKSLKAYGSYRSIASKILQKKAKGKATISDIEFLKKDKKIKAKLEKALNIKIDDVSAEVSSKRSAKILATFLGMPGAIVGASRDKEYKRLASK